MHLFGGNYINDDEDTETNENKHLIKYLGSIKIMIDLILSIII
jgi:hypothetical protein